MFTFENTFINLRQAASASILMLLLFLFVILISSKKMTISAKLLTYLVFSFIVIYSLTVIFHFKLNSVFLFTFFLFVPSYVFIAPLSYLFIRSILIENYKFSRNEFRHFYIPILFMVLNFIVNELIVYFNYSQQQELSQYFSLLIKQMPLLGINIIISLQLIIYGFLSLKLYLQYRRTLDDFFSSTNEISLIFTIFIVNNNDYLTFFDVLNRFVD